MSSKLKQYYINLNLFINKHEIIHNLIYTKYKLSDKKNISRGFLFSIILLSVYNLNKSELIKSTNIYYFVICVDLILYSIKHDELQENYTIIMLLFTLSFKHIDNDTDFILYEKSIIDFLNNTIINKVDKENAYYSFCSLSFILMTKLILKKEIYQNEYKIIKKCGECLGYIFLYYEKIIDDYQVYMNNKIEFYEMIYKLNLMTETAELILNNINTKISKDINNHIKV